MNERDKRFNEDVAKMAAEIRELDNVPLPLMVMDGRRIDQLRAAYGRKASPILVSPRPNNCKRGRLRVKTKRGRKVYTPKNLFLPTSF